ncbi:MAG TPA: aldo/keto reductase [Tepidisphaeraceae bacterium]|jgi:aryl-alcohol dehydrogenase-like predicted oxidoreductase|nr:aldo/keto reductase [Tepidisphaeraceae bacterium]
MEKVTFGKTNLSVSRLGFGGAPIGYLKTDQERVAKILAFLLDHGVNVIDTAANYPGSEAAIAQAIGNRRSEFVLISKCGTALPDVSATPWSADMISTAVDRSLKNLRTDHLDVMLLHSCDLKTLEKGEAIAALAKARQAGKIRFAGYSGDNEAAAYAAAHPDIAVLQTSISIADQINIHKALPIAQKHNVGVMAKRPIANAAWKHADAQQGLYKNYAQTYHDRLKAMKLNPADLGFAADAWAEIAMRFTLSQSGVHVAIIGTTNPDNAESNLASAKKGPLPADVIAKIEAAFRAADPQGKWAGQT